MQMLVQEQVQQEQVLALEPMPVLAQEPVADHLEKQARELENSDHQPLVQRELW